MAADVLRAALTRRRTEGEQLSVFASRFASRQTLARHSLSQAMRRLAVLRASPHDFRRTVATGLARLGVAREDRLAVLGHAMADVHSRHYDMHERAMEKRRALARWERHVAALLGAPAAGAEVVRLPRRQRQR
jgi:integrase